MCGHVTLTPTPSGVVVAAPSGQYTIDADETPLAAGTSLDAARTTCERKGERLCTSDEWNLVCVCTYPNEAVGGSKVSTNERMVYRQDSDRAGAPEDVRRLLTGASELVTPSVSGGGVLVAGPNDEQSDPWTADCRYRGLLDGASVRWGVPGRSSPRVAVAEALAARHPLGFCEAVPGRRAPVENQLLAARAPASIFSRR